MLDRAFRPPLRAHAFLGSESPERVRADRDRLRTIVDNGNAVIYVKDNFGRYLFVNRRFEELFHLTPEDIVGRTDFETFPVENASILRQTISR